MQTQTQIATTISGARHIALNGNQFNSTVRTIAWRTLKASRGHSMNSQRMLVKSMAVIHAENAA